MTDERATVTADREEGSRDAVVVAFDEFLRRGALERDWPAWAALFTDDAHYVEHGLGTFDGASGVKDWIVAQMAEFACMTFSVEWWMTDGSTVAFWLWNHLPDPKGRGREYAFPNGSLITYAGDALWSSEEDFYNPFDAAAVVAAWLKAGGRTDLPAEPDLRPRRRSHPPLPAAPDQAVAHAVAEALVSENWLDLVDTSGAEYHDHGGQPIERWSGVPRREIRRVVDGARVAVVVEHELPALLVAHVNEHGRVVYLDHVYNPKDRTRA